MTKRAFEELNLIQPLLQSIVEQNYSEPTDIQKQAIPIILSGDDLIACAQTGTGKSAAFCLPLLQKIHIEKTLNGHQGIRALILAPTRELATQIEVSLSIYGSHTCVNHTAIFGGIPRKVQIDHLSRQIDILVATPGRLLDMVQREHVGLSNIGYLVLDEADSMLNLGFLEDVERVINLLPPQRQTLLFSATIPYQIANLAKNTLHNPTSISIKVTHTPLPNIKQELYYVDVANKNALLLHLLNTNHIDGAFIFVATKQGASQLAEELCLAGFNAEAIHSERSQIERTQALERFRSREITLLVATDLVARGIDIEGVSHIFNMSLPQESDNYIHRIGRTGRAGNQGIAMSLCTPTDLEKVRKIEKLIKQKISVNDAHPYMNLELRKKLFIAQDQFETPQPYKTKRRKRAR